MSIKNAIETTRHDLERFEHPCLGKRERGTGVYYMPTNFVSFATDGEYSYSQTKPEQYDGVVEFIHRCCREEQRAEIRQLVLAIVRENETNRTERFPQTNERQFEPQEYDPSTGWGAAMIALAKHFGAELPLSK